jgi:hypothetical protein
MRARCACPPSGAKTIDSKNGGHGAKSAFAHPTDYPARLHCPLFLRFSMVCMQFCAHAQPGVAHLFEHALMHALTSQFAAACTDGATATASP